MGKVTQTYITQSEEETFQLGTTLAKTLKTGTTISLEGDLGTGKTAITKGLAKGFGIDDYITSPTFTLVNTYEGETLFHHFDVYRVDDPDELYAIGWEEYFSEDAVTVVEWGDRVPNMLPPDTMHIRLERHAQNPDHRKITVERQVL